ncbi:MAG: hypothetical protein KDE27_03950 [Planctomycetes bacterium]|nr:hypothetical protein [Planctomycetota bacterium]
MSAARSAPLLALAIRFAALAGLASCVGYVRYRTNEPIPLAALEQLRPERDDLASCLQRLGAPVHVFANGADIVLLWSWQDTDDWSADVSLPVAEWVNADFELDLTFAERLGCGLWFDPDLVLAGWRAGRIGDLLPRRQRPAPVDRSGG